MAKRKRNTKSFKNFFILFTEVDEEEVDNQDVAVKEPGTFSWEAAIIGVLKRASDHKLPIKKLRKKVFTSFRISYQSF